MAGSFRKSASWAMVVVLTTLSFDAVCGLRILGIFPMNGKSHFVMCESLMRGLAARGHQVDVYTHFPLKKPIPNYTDYSLAGSIPLISNNMSYEFANSFSKKVSVPQLLEVLGTPICNLMNLPIFQKLVKNPPTDPPYDFVIVEAFFANCYLAWGRHLNIPMATVVSTPLFDWLNAPLGNPNNLAAEPSVFSRFMTPMSFLERVQNYFLSTYISTSFNYHAREQDEIVHRIFGSHFPNVIELQKDIALALVNYNHAINGIRPLTPMVVPVGGIHVVDGDDQLPQKVKKFLDESKNGFIYVSFGSMVRIETFPKPVLDVFYKTFEKIAPVRVLMKIAKPDELPQGLPSNVITDTWLPQVKVLKHKNIRAFVTHGGLMGTQESIYHGVPMIGFPLFGDQHFNIESYAKKNMAIKLSQHDLTEEIFTGAVQEILSNPVYKRSAEKVGSAFRDVPLSPMDSAAFWIEYVARHGKDALRSPLMDMPWWQVHLLDIYAFFGSILLALVCLVKFVLSKLICAFCHSASGQKTKTKVKNN